MLHVEKKQKFDMLVENVARCDLCKRMQGRPKVLSEKNGNLNARVVFIGEAPGRFGADRTGVPFYGDQTSRRQKTPSFRSHAPLLKNSGSLKSA